MEPKNRPIEKEHHLPNLHFGVNMLIFQGVLIRNPAMKGGMSLSPGPNHKELKKRPQTLKA